jgi:hypothetical protein
MDSFQQAAGLIMELKKQFPFATRSLTLLVIGVGLILILVYIGFYNYRGIAKLDAEINELNTNINTHQSYAPMTKQLFERMKVKAQRNLPLPAKAKLSGEQKDQISLIFKDMAQKSKMELVSDGRGLRGHAGPRNPERGVLQLPKFPDRAGRQALPRKSRGDRDPADARDQGVPAQGVARRRLNGRCRFGPAQREEWLNEQA